MPLGHKHKRLRLLTIIGVFFLWITLIFTTGCQELVKSRLSSASIRAEKALQDRYVLALNAYFSGDFIAAADTFAAIEGQTTDRLLKRRALFGLACTRLMMAGTRDEFASAMSHWDAWVNLAPQHWVSENPLLFAPILNEKIALPEPPKNPEVADAVERPPPPPVATWQDLKLKRELEQTRSQLEKTNQDLTQRQETIQNLEEEIVKLKEQIKAIELIDQKMQEKKQAIPSTD